MLVTPARMTNNPGANHFRYSTAEGISVEAERKGDYISHVAIR